MARGPSRSRRLREIAEAEQLYGPDLSQIVHTFDDDGWTIRRLDAKSDLLREGQLMHLCVGWDAVDGLGVYAAHLYYGVMYSLRDPVNFPHVTFLHVGDERVSLDAEGHSGTPVGAHHKRRIDQWHDTIGARWLDDPLLCPEREFDPNYAHPLSDEIAYAGTLALVVEQVDELLNYSHLPRIDSDGITPHHLAMRQHALELLAELLLPDEHDLPPLATDDEQHTPTLATAGSPTPAGRVSPAPNTPEGGRGRG